MSLTTLVHRVPFAERGHVARYNAYAFTFERAYTAAAAASHSESDESNVGECFTGGWAPDAAHAFVEIGVGPLGVLRLSLAEARALRDALAQVVDAQEPEGA